MYTNVDGSNFNFRLYRGGSCETDCTTDCSDQCTKYCNAAKNDTESHKTRISALIKQAKDLQEKLKGLGNNFKVVDYGGRKTRKRGGFFATNTKCEEKCKSTCKTNCNILCENAMEEFSDQMKKVKKEISILNELISKVSKSSSSRHQPQSSSDDWLKYFALDRVTRAEKEKEEREKREKEKKP